MTWQVVAAAGAGAAVLLSFLGFAWYAMSRVHDAQGRAAVVQQNLDVERRLRRDAEKARDEALANVAAHEKTIATLRAVAKVDAEELARADTVAAKEEQDAIADSPDGAADVAVDLMRG